jgi:hypothetical protein
MALERLPQWILRGLVKGSQTFFPEEGGPWFSVKFLKGQPLESKEPLTPRKTEST